MNHTELVDSITGALRPQGDGDVDVAALRAGTMTRVRAARRRRIAVAGVAAGVTVAIVALLAPRVGGPASEIGAPPSVSGTPAMTPATALPPADVPGAAQRPDTVGSDRAVLHFDVDMATFGGTGTWWRTAPGVERVEIWTGSDAGGDYRNAVTVVVSQSLATARLGDLSGSGAPSVSPVAVTVAGRPGQIQAFPEMLGAGTTSWELWWQPVDGVWAVLTMQRAPDAAAVVAVAGGVRFDRSVRCAVPIRMTAPPPGFQWDECTTGLEPPGPNRRSWQTASLQFRNALGGTVNLYFGNYSNDATDGDKFVPNRTVNGAPAMWFATEGAWHLAVPSGDQRNVFVAIRGEGVTEQDALTVAGAAEYSDNLMDLTSWPARAVG